MYYTVSFWVFGFEGAAFRLWRMVLTDLFVEIYTLEPRFYRENRQA